METVMTETKKKSTQRDQTHKLGEILQRIEENDKRETLERPQEAERGNNILLGRRKLSVMYHR